jgi:DNA replication initiation complex subunit (GINS family)
MVDIRITYETLFDLLRREKNREELQELDKDFYEQVLAYLKEKKSDLTKKGDELFASAEREKLKIQFQNIRRIIKELYERREKKIITIAMSKARTGSDVIDTTALLPSERQYFEEQVALFVKYKEKVLDTIIEVRELDDKSPLLARPIAVIERAAEPVPKALIRAVEEENEEEDEEQGETGQDDNLPDASPEAAFATASELEAGVETETKRIRVLNSLPKFVGMDGTILGPYDEGDEIELDHSIAELLIKKGSAEPCKQ